MYQLGIHRRAQPLERLQRRYMEFQRRMMTTTAPPDEEPSLDENPIQRTALAPTGSRTAVSTNENVRAGNATARPPSSGRATQVQAVPAQPQPQTKPGKMAIFSDPEGSAARPAQQGTWSELGTQQQRNRENLREKEKWTDVRVPSAAPAPVGKIQVWTDDVSFRRSCLLLKLESTEDPFPCQQLDSLKPQAHPVSANSAILREKPVTAVEAHHGLLSSAEEVSEEPAPTPVPVPAAAAPPSRPSSAGPSGPSSSRPAGSKTASSKKAAAPAAPQPVVGERPAVSFHLVYPSSAGVSFADAASGAKKCEEEKSFEEIRAERKYGLLGYVSESEPDSGGEEEEEEEPAEVFNRTTGSRHFDAVVPIGDDGKLDATVTLSFRDKRKSVASPTINTKKAMSDVYAMFSGDLDEDDQVGRRRVCGTSFPLWPDCFAFVFRTITRNQKKTILDLCSFLSSHQKRFPFSRTRTRMRRRLLPRPRWQSSGTRNRRQHHHQNQNSASSLTRLHLHRVKLEKQNWLFSPTQRNLPRLHRPGSSHGRLWELDQLGLCLLLHRQQSHLWQFARFSSPLVVVDLSTKTTKGTLSPLVPTVPMTVTATRFQEKVELDNPCALRKSLR